MSVYEDLQGLVDKAVTTGLIEARDRTYATNRVLYALGLEALPDDVEQASDAPIPELLERLVADAVARGVMEDVLDDKEMLAAHIMDCFVPRPSAVEEIFWRTYDHSPQAATDYFYALSQNSNYIQTQRIEKNVHFKADSAYGTMDITINLSKPEKDPEQIRREREMTKDLGYPPCVLCAENEGYAGRTGHPARANHRIIQIDLLGENWYFQYSPYVYYNEHSIVLSEEHRPMKINRATFERLIAFTEKFPHYFIGSNADLPIVGGSILSHDHYQAGRYEFAMTRAKNAFTFTLDGFPDVSANVLQWPMAVIRLQSNDKDSLIHAADHVLKTWKSYDDEDAQIRAFTGKTPHNTVTPIARIRDRQYELDLVLRNNRTSDEHPQGIFHPHGDVQHIKKENIGLIEVMGLAVLPARLKGELNEIKQFLLGQKSAVAPYHQQWADEMKTIYGEMTDAQKVDAILEKELGKKFTRVLEDAGVFKERKAFERFIAALNT